MSQDESLLFQDLMGDVTPIKQDQVTLKQPHQVTESQRARQESAISHSDNDPDFLSLTNAPPLAPDDFITFKRNGLQEGVYRKLRLGKYPIQARLDLHRYSLKKARDELVKFIQQCQWMDIRTVLIIHGKGEHSNPPALIKSYVAHWLPQLENVQCVHTAQRFHGGQGALYVMIKKSQEKKLDNRERHQKRQP